MTDPNEGRGTCSSGKASMALELLNDGLSPVRLFVKDRRFFASEQAQHPGDLLLSSVMTVDQEDALRLRSPKLLSRSDRLSPFTKLEHRRLENGHRLINAALFGGVEHVRRRAVCEHQQRVVHFSEAGNEVVGRRRAPAGGGSRSAAATRSG